MAFARKAVIAWRRLCERKILPEGSVCGWRERAPGADARQGVHVFSCLLRHLRWWRNTGFSRIKCRLCGGMRGRYEKPTG